MSVRLALNILLVAGIVATVAGGAVLLFRDAGSPDGVTITLDEPDPAPAFVSQSAAAPATIKVYISGEARRPGVYELPTDARLDDALQAAGGPTSDAALELVNLAKRLSDEEHIHIPGLSDGSARVSAGEDIPPSAASEVARDSAGRLNINTATVDELTSLPNIGPSRAAAIVDYREREGPFGSVDELMNVGGIGEKITDSIRDLVAVR